MLHTAAQWEIGARPRLKAAVPDVAADQESLVSDIEIVTLTYSFVLGLGIAQILGAASAAIRDRRSRPLHWMPLAFAAAIFFLHIQYWFVLTDYDAFVIDDWTWASYGAFLLVAVVLFLAGGIVLPTPGAESTDALIDDFEKNGKLSLLFVAAYQLFWVPGNAMWDGWLSIAVWYNLALTVPLLVAYFARPGPLRNAAAALYFAALAFALLFIWSTPADIR